MVVVNRLFYVVEPEAKTFERLRGRHTGGNCETSRLCYAVRYCDISSVGVVVSVMNLAA